jgi:hypothetical protein
MFQRDHKGWLRLDKALRRRSRRLAAEITGLDITELDITGLDIRGLASGIPGRCVAPHN